VLSGTGTPGDTITIKDDAGQVVGTAVVAANGSWAITPTTPLPEGLNELSVTATNPTGQTSEPTALPITVDTSVPTGVTATAAQAQEAHAFVRSLVAEQFGADSAAKIRIQYGGSVKPDNAKELLGQPDVDGALVGGASLKLADFAAIVAAAKA
jgi:hypothetical protein